VTNSRLHPTRPTIMRAFLSRAAAFGAALLLALAPAALHAQAGTTSGAIRGRVVDAGSQPLVGAVVTATNQETGLARSAQVDDQGQYVIRLLPPGTYTVGARRIGSQPTSQAGVRVLLSQTSTVNLTLQVATVTLSAVQVTAEAEVDVSDAGVKTHVSTEEIQNLPTLGRDFTDFINLSGTVSPDPEATTGGQFSIAGQRPSQTNLQIDGVDANNAFFGENRGGSRVPFNFSLESIREFQIVTNGYDVEYGNYSGGVVNIVTRGGTNQFKGTVYGNFRNQELVADNFDGTPVSEFNAAQYAASFEGPVIQDRLHFLVSLDGQRRREPFGTWSPASLRASEFAADGALADSLERFIDILETRYGVSNAAGNFGEFQTTDDVITLFGRLDWTLSDRHRLSLRNNYVSHDNANEGFNASGGRGTFRGGLSTAESFKDKNNSVVGELTSELGTNLFNTLRLQYAWENRPRTPNNNLPGLNVQISSGERLEYGGNFISFRNVLDEQKFQFVDNLTLVRGDHAIKLGTNNTFSKFDNTFWRNGTGVYQFASLADFENFRPTSYSRNIRADSQPPTASFSAQEYSAYVQDDWQISPRLLGTFGLRYDVSRIGSRPGRVIDVERAFGIETGIAPVDNDNIAPRVSFTFDVNGDATSVVRAGAGMFYGRMPYVLASNVASTDVPPIALTCAGAIENDAGFPDPDAPPPVEGYIDWSASGDDNPFACRGGSGLGGLPEYSFWTENFEMPETFKANVGYERRFAGRTTISTDFLFSNTTKLYTVRNLNLRDAQFTIPGEADRSVFVPRTVTGSTTQSAFNPANTSSATASPDRFRNTDFTDVFANYNDGVARSWVATANLEHRFENRNSLRASYTYTRAEDNSSFSCCTSFEGFTSPNYGALGPNFIGAAGDDKAGWGPSEFERRHVVVLSGFARLPYGFRVSGFWRMQSGTPWSPEAGGDLNADGVAFNDRPFIFAPSEFPVFVDPAITDPVRRDSIVAVNRLQYARDLADNECVGDYVGQVVPRNTCRQPWFNRLDLSIRKDIPTVNGQSAELSLDLFNVLNGLNNDWGRYEAVSSADRNIMVPRSYDATTNQILYTAGNSFGTKQPRGQFLLLQFSAQVGVRYRF
jgi:outer membrane receptor for ferrienterochelin and colicin